MTYRLRSEETSCKYIWFVRLILCWFECVLSLAVLCNEYSEIKLVCWQAGVRRWKDAFTVSTLAALFV